MAEGRQIDLSTMGVEELTNLKTQHESVTKIRVVLLYLFVHVC